MEKLLSKILTVLLLSFSFMLFSFQSAFALEPSSNVIYRGIDVSEFQGNINYNEVKNAGIEIVYIRSSEGTNFIDPFFKTNYENAKANGLKVGFYHYVTARDTESAIQEADFFASVIEGTSPDCKLAMDFEYFDGLSTYEVNEISITFLNRLQQVTNKDVIVYSDAYNAQNVFNKEVASYPLWIADYFVSTPAPNDNWNFWVGFQYSDIGNIPGISGRVDLDQYSDGILLNDTSTITNSGNTIQAQNDNNQISITVTRGETLSSIAFRYGTTVTNLVKLNNIQNPNLIYIGQRLLISTTNNAINNTNRNNSSVYIVKAGNTLNQIANEFNVTVESIAIENNIQNPNLIFVGQRLIIEDIRYDTHETNHSIYTIRYGDTLSQISRRYNVSIEQIATLNNISNINLIFVGQKLRI